MDAYILDASLLCDDCGRSAPGAVGPYSDGGGEADSPQHCDVCGRFLENPLTCDGMLYVEDAMREDFLAGRRDSVALREWRPYYGIPLSVRA